MAVLIKKTKTVIIEIVYSKKYVILWPENVNGRTWMQSIIQGYLNLKADLIILIGKLQVFHHFYLFYVTHDRRQRKLLLIIMEVQNLNLHNQT